MAHRNTIRAKKLRGELIERLGGKCDLCPCTEESELQFDHKNGTDWVLNKLSYLQRMNLYVREAAQEKLRLLCGVCNRKVRVPGDGKAWQRTAYRDVPAENIPF